MTATQPQITYSNEIARKSIHLASLLIPVIYLQLEHWKGISILVGITAFSLMVDALKHYHKPTRNLMMPLVGRLLRSHELREDRFYLTGASWVLIAATTTFVVFPTSIGVAAFTVLIISDTSAALVGRQFGVRPFFDKSALGTATFMITAVAVVAVYGHIYAQPWTFYTAGIVASVVAGVTEAASSRLRVDDNIAVPYSFAGTMWVLGTIMNALSHPDFIHSLP